jgi:hypothetical protein
MKLCKFGCGQYVEWNDALHAYVIAGTTNPHTWKTCPAKAEAREEPKPTAKPTSNDLVVKHLARIADALEYLARTK